MRNPATRGQRSTTSSPHSPFAALEHRDFRIVWFGQMVSTGGSTMQGAAVAWQVYLLTHSAVALGLVGLCRVIPIVLLSLGGGVVADVVERRRLLLVTQSILLLVSATLAITTIVGVINIWVIYGLIALAACATAFDLPARQALVPALVPSHKLANALTLNSTMYQAASVAGPAVAGLVIASRGVWTVYAVDACSFLSVLAALLLIHPPRTVGAIQKISVRAALDGLRFIRATPILMSTMLLDFVATFCGSATALLPIFAHDILRAGALGYGILYAAPAAGAIAAGVVMAFVTLRIRRQGMTILVAVGVYGLCTIVFGLSHDFLLSLLALAGTGAADTVSMILRQTVRQLVTPDALRGRMTSVSMIFFMGGPQLGDVEAGLMARAFGAPFSVVSGGVLAVVATVLIAYNARGLRRYPLWDDQENAA